MEKFIIVKDIIKRVNHFKLTGRTVEFKIKQAPVKEDPVSWVKSAVNQVIERSTDGLRPTDQVWFTFCSKDFQRGESWIRFKSADQIKYDDVWNVISSVYQSNSSGLNTETFCLGVTTVKMPIGSGSSRQSKYNSFDDECAMRKGIVTIENKDNLCLPRALVVAIAKSNKDPEYAKIRKDTGKIRTRKALELMEKSGIIISEEGAGIPELEKFQQFFQDFKLSFMLMVPRVATLCSEVSMKAVEISACYITRDITM